MAFFNFWWTAICASFEVGWLVFGVVSTIMPTLIALIQRHWSQAASIGWIKWVADNQIELQLGIGVLIIVIYLVYAPYDLYRTRESNVIILNTEIRALRERVNQLEQSNQLGLILDRLSTASKKGSLSSRTAALANELLKTEEERNKTFWKRSEEDRAMIKRGLPMQDVWEASSSKAHNRWAEDATMFNQRFTARLLIIIEELRANGITDQKLELWHQSPSAASAHMAEFAIALSKLALAMEDKENQSAP